jgi:hypothetical protein
VSESQFDARDVLLKSASRLEEKGMWCQRSFYKWQETGDALTLSQAIELEAQGGKVSTCAEGVISLISRKLGVPDFEERQARTLLYWEIGGRFVPSWNDAPSRTAQDVADAMRRAATRE